MYYVAPVFIFRNEFAYYFMSLFIKAIILFLFFNIKAHTSWFSGHFCEQTFAGLSDQKKSEFIENLAQPLSEDKVFYRWELSPTIASTRAEELLAAGELTPDMHDSFWSRDRYIAAGPGVYFSESIYSASTLPLSSYIIQVVAQRGVKVLDTSNNGVQEKLMAAGIAMEDVHRLPAEVIVSDFREDIDDWWIFKGSKGIKFTPFSIHSVGLDDLVMARKLQFTKYKDQFKDLDLEGHIEERVRKAVKSPVHSLEEGVNLFVLGEPYFSESERSRALDQIIDNIQTVEDGKKLFKRQYAGFNRSSLKKELNSPPLDSAESIYPTSQEDPMHKAMKATRKSFGLSLSEPERLRLFSRILDCVQTVQDGITLLIFNTSQDGVFSEENEQAIVDKIKKYPIDDPKTASALIFRGDRNLSDSDIVGIIEAVSPNIRTVAQAALFSDFFEKLPESTVTKILKQVLPDVDGYGFDPFNKAKKLLSIGGKYLSDPDITKLVNAMLPGMRSIYVLKEILSAGGGYFSDLDIEKIERHAYSRLGDTKEVSIVLEKAGKLRHPSAPH